MPSFSFTDKAVNDIESIIDFTVEHWGKSQAKIYLDGLEDLAQTLSEHPSLGQDRVSLSKNLYSFPYQKHIIYYVKSDNGIVIIRVLHSAMDAIKHLPGNMF